MHDFLTLLKQPLSINNKIASYAEITLLYPNLVKEDRWA